MSTNNVRQELRKFILENYLFTDDEAALNDDDSFLNSGILDSMGILELIEHLTDNLSIKVEGNEMIPENLDSINNLVKFISLKTHS